MDTSSLPQLHGLGTPPSGPDVQISRAFAAFFGVTAFMHIVIFALNRRFGLFFFSSVLMCVHSVLALTALVLRSYWAAYPANGLLASTSPAVTAIGIVVLYLINFDLTGRMVHLRRSHIGWDPSISVLLCGIADLLAAASLVPSIVFDGMSTQSARTVQQTCAGVFIIFAAFPAVVFLLILATCRRNLPNLFGSHRYRTTVALLVSSSAILTVGAAFRFASAVASASASDAPLPWLLSNTCLYLAVFGPQGLVSLAYVIFRVDRRFGVPHDDDGSNISNAQLHNPPPDTGDGSTAATTRADESVERLSSGAVEGEIPERTLGGPELDIPAEEQVGRASPMDPTPALDPTIMGFNAATGEYELTVLRAVRGSARSDGSDQV